MAVWPVNTRPSFHAVAVIKVDILCFATCNLIFKYSQNTSTWEIFPSKQEECLKLLVEFRVCCNFLQLHKLVLLFYLSKFHRSLINAIIKKWSMCVIDIRGMYITNIRTSCCFTPLAWFFNVLPLNFIIRSEDFFGDLLPKDNTDTEDRSSRQYCWFSVLSYLPSLNSCP